MRAVEAENGMMLCRDEHRGQISGSAVAKVEVLANLGRGYLRVRVAQAWFGKPACLRRSGSGGDEERQVQSRFCCPWREAHERDITARQARAAEGRRQRTAVENIVNLLGIGTVAANGRAFFEYEETVDLAQRLGLEFTTGSDEGGDGER
jgi:hypothetical protein